MKKKLSSKITGLEVINPSIFYDFRGQYVETYNKKNYHFTDENNQVFEFVEDDISISHVNVLRGLHGDHETWKLTQCLMGEVYMVVVDMRKQSPTYLNWEAFHPNEANRQQILIPSGCASGYLCLSPKCIFSYKQSKYYQGSSSQLVVRWNDPIIKAFWPISNPILSLRDSTALDITP